MKVDVGRIDRYAPEKLIRRDDELEILRADWENVRRAAPGRAHVRTFVALGGEGKTSLVAKWTAKLAADDWLGCDAAFGWSFYSQGTKEQSVASSDLFLREALTFFGDPAMANSPRMAFEKGKRLAELVGTRRALLILDGLEPLQYPPSSPLRGHLRDDGLAVLLKGLAARSRGLCVVTTRYSVPDLKNYRETTAPEENLLRLSPEAGAALLRLLGAHGAASEIAALVELVKGHALTLNLLGTYLKDAHGGDVRKHDLVRLEEADAEVQGGHAFRVMDAYVAWFESEGKKSQRAIAVLRLLGLFDRPAPADCLIALRRVPAIPNLTEALVGILQAQWNIALARLAEANLLTVNRDATGTLLSLDAHPLIREYFAARLRDQHPEAWCAAHRRLFEHLCKTTTDKPLPTLEDLQPLYQAVAHGCKAGMHLGALKVFLVRITRGKQAYTTRWLGAIGADLEALASFFDSPWSQVSPAINEVNEPYVQAEAGFRLRALTRLTEARELMQAGAEGVVFLKDWTNAAIYSSNLSELDLLSGELAGSIGEAEQSITGNYIRVGTKRVPGP